MSEVVSFTKTKILQAVEEYRELEIRNEKGSPTDNLLYQMREDGEGRWLFICHGNKPENSDVVDVEKIDIRIKGVWNPVIYDTMNGKTYPCEGSIVEDETRIKYEFYAHDSLLLYLQPEKPREDNNSKLLVNKKSKELHILDPVPVTLSEPNVLLLDIAEYSFDKGSWQPKEELLRIDNKFRQQLGYPLRMEALAQPWVNEKQNEPDHKLSLRFTIISDIEVVNPYLALEGLGNTEIIVNKERVPSIDEGWYVDKCIKKVKIPNLPSGESEIILNIDYKSKTNVEWCYLLGDFGVKVEGSRARIIEPIRELSFGDWSVQGLPFYAGNVTYHCEVETNDCNLSVEIPQYRNPLLSLALDGEEKGKIVFAPYTLDLGKLKAGKHKVDITAFGNRVNTFGTLHNCNHSTTWFGPNAWRTTASSWSYEYQLKKIGVLVSPRFRTV